jgi:hypothetical protein
MRAVFSILVALVLLGVFGLGAGIGFGILAQRIADGVSGTVALGCVTLLATTILALWQFDRTKRKEAEARIFALRAPIYERLIGIVREKMFETKGWAEEKAPDSLAKDLAIITYDMIVWGGQSTVRALMSLGETPTDDTAAVFRTMQNIFKAIRKDLGHNDDDSLPADLVVQLIIPEERDRVRSLLRQAK